MKQFCRKLCQFVLFITLFSLLGTRGRATTIVMLSDTELIASSRLIVSGQVKSVTAARDEASAMVWTYVEVQTDRVLKGDLSEGTIVLKQLGGAAGDSGVRVFGQPDFARGERVLLYLNTGPDGSLHSAHASIGKFSIVEDRTTGTEFVQRSIDSSEIELLVRTDGEQVTNRAPLDSYVSKIQDTLQREAVKVATFASAQRGQPLVTAPNEYARSRTKLFDFAPQFVLFGPARWMEADAGQAIRYYVNSNASPVAGGGTAEIARAMDAWPSQSGASIRLEVAGQTASCGIVANYVNTISFGDCLNQLDPPVGCSGVAAMTAILWTYDSRPIGGVSFNRLIEADIIFNKGFNCFLGNSANLAEVATHELGHSIGLAHSADASAIMWAVSHGQGRDATLGADDKAGALAIYPATSGGPGPVGGGPVSITSLKVSEGVVGRSYAAVLSATGGTPSYRWSLAAGALPPGLSLSTSGTIGGVPTSSGSYTFAAQVFDSGIPVRTDSRWLSVTIQTGGPVLPAITRVKLKGERKLRLFGENFRADSLVLINGLAYQPLSFEEDGSALMIKGNLGLGPEGTNIAIVINRDYNSAPFFF